MSGRRIIYPYTLPAKLASFPFKYYYENSPFFKYWIWSIAICLPFFYKMQKLSCTEENYAKLAEYRKKEIAEFEKHKEHLL